MSERKQVVERYFEGFRRGDHELVLGRFAYADAFRDHAVCRVESYVVPLTPPPSA